MGKGAGSWPGRAVRVAVLADIHANLPALEAALADIRRAGADLMVHTGDVVGFGPHPGECLDLVLATAGLACITGNHDSWALNNDAGPGKPPPVLEHLNWTWQRVSPAHRRAMADWPFRMEREFEAVRAVFQHYGLDPSGRDFLPIERPGIAVYDRMFEADGAAAVFFGHDHSASDTAGRARYLDPGSLGTGPEPVARWVLASFMNGKMEAEKRAAAYDREPLWRAFEERRVPGRELVIEKFYRTQSP